MRRHTAICVAATAFILGGIASQLLPAVYSQPEPKGPTWEYGLNTRVRKGDENNFNKDTRKIGIEVYQDGNNGNWIYVSETGSISVVPGK